MMEEQNEKVVNIDLNLDEHFMHTNLTSDNNRLSVEEEVVVTSSKEEPIISPNEYMIDRQSDDVEMQEASNVKFGGERRMNVSVSVGGGIGRGGGMRTVVLHVPKDIQ